MAIALADQWPEPGEILRHFYRAQEAFHALRKELQVNMPKESRFFGLTPEELDRAFDETLRELDQEVILLLAASFEAVILVDLQRRVMEKRKDTASRALRTFWKRKRKKRLNVEDVLEQWKKLTKQNRIIGELNQLIEYRHWLAHGRYWKQHSGLTNPDPLLAWERGRAVFDELPDFPRLPPA